MKYITQDTVLSPTDCPADVCKVPLKKRKHVLASFVDYTKACPAISYKAPQQELTQDASILISPPQTPPTQNGACYNNSFSPAYLATQNLKYPSPSCPHPVSSSPTSFISISSSNKASSVESRSCSQVSNERVDHDSPARASREYRPRRSAYDNSPVTSQQSHSSSTKIVSSGFHISARPNLLDDIINFSPLNLLPDSEDDITSPKVKRSEKQKKYIYCIGGKPITSSSKISLTGRKRSSKISISKAKHSNMNYKALASCSSEKRQNCSDDMAYAETSQSFDDFHRTKLTTDSETLSGPPPAQLPRISNEEDGSEQSARDNKNTIVGQNCIYCFNHGFPASVHGHMSKCKYRFCNCQYCDASRNRQKHTQHQELKQAKHEHETIDITDSDYMPPFYVRESSRLDGHLAVEYMRSSDRLSSTRQDDRILQYGHESCDRQDRIPHYSYMSGNSYPEIYYDNDRKMPSES